MAKHELRKPLDTLLTKKNELDQKKITINDQHTRYQTELQSLRNDQTAYRTAKETLSNTVSNKPSRKVFDDQISTIQLRVNEVLKELDRVEKDNEVVVSQIKAIDKSIKELQNS